MGLICKWRTAAEKEKGGVFAPPSRHQFPQPQSGSSVPWNGSFLPHFWHRQKSPPQPGRSSIVPWHSGQFLVSMSPPPVIFFTIA
ncbi:hypothetical protein GPICK_13535 [Geobacter pickeringii]|uniref:Uncharacterized protein n=1 Tax=Geobacter pickeringii TaxID=345632 RepID=A0A0B5BBW8_9BACT|nr:hypothetical protein GPICK_13535 [Geobacter pickeringii]